MDTEIMPISLDGDEFTSLQVLVISEHIPASRGRPSKSLFHQKPLEPPVSGDTIAPWTYLYEVYPASYWLAGI